MHRASSYDRCAACANYNKFNRTIIGPKPNRQRCQPMPRVAETLRHLRGECAIIRGGRGSVPALLRRRCTHTNVCAHARVHKHERARTRSCARTRRPCLGRSAPARGMAGGSACERRAEVPRCTARSRSRRPSRPAAQAAASAATAAGSPQAHPLAHEGASPRTPVQSRSRFRGRYPE
jgi:hypothetical protein